MFGPRHTAESVTRELIKGLEAGDIVLPQEHPPAKSLEEVLESPLANLNQRHKLQFLAEVRVEVEETLAKASRKERRLVIGTGLAALACILLTLAGSLAAIPEEQPKIVSLIPALAGVIAAAMAALATVLMVALLSARGRKTELKTYTFVLQKVDEHTAERIASEVVGPKLKELAR
jgi:hypothetical protein